MLILMLNCNFDIRFLEKLILIKVKKYFYKSELIPSTKSECKNVRLISIMSSLSKPPAIFIEYFVTPGSVISRKLRDGKKSHSSYLGLSEQTHTYSHRQTLFIHNVYTHYINRRFLKDNP